MSLVGQLLSQTEVGVVPEPFSGSGTLVVHQLKRYFPKGLKIRISLGNKVMEPNSAAIMARPVSNPK